MSDENSKIEEAIEEVEREEDEAEENPVETEDVSLCVEQLKKENARLVRQLLRLKADFENFRRRSAGQMENIVVAANEELLQDVLPVLDNFQRALYSPEGGCSQDDPFYQGVEMVYRSLLRALENYGLKPIEAAGRPFDPNFHEAISLEGEGGDSLVVLKETQTGYLLNGKVIRHAKVLVGQSEEAE